MSDYQRFQEKARRDIEEDKEDSSSAKNEQQFLRRSKRGAMAHMQTYYMWKTTPAKVPVTQNH